MKLGHYKTLKQPKIFNNHVHITSMPMYVLKVAGDYKSKKIYFSWNKDQNQNHKN